jgi:putative ATPase
VAYLALAPKSNAATTAINQARQDVREQKIIPVPKHLRDGHYAGARELDRGVGYKYAHNHPDGVVTQSYLGVDREYYQPVPRGFENQLLERIKTLREALRGEA